MEKFDSITVEIDFNEGSWTDVSSEVRSGSVRWRRGIIGNAPQERTGQIGTMSFSLKNQTNKYSPGHASAQSGFGVGNKVRLSFTFEGTTKRKYQGKIPRGGIGPVTGTKRQRTTTIEVHDWMKQVNQHELRLMELATDQRSDQAIALIDANLQVSPINTDYRTGTANFPRVFHITRDRTKAIAEIKNIVDSEISYYYVKGDNTDGETVVLEDRFARSTSVTPKSIPINIANSGRRLAEDGTFLLDESGDKRVWNETESASYTDNMRSMEVAVGSHHANQVKSKSYPVKVDAAATTILFTLNDVIELTAGQELSAYRGAYTDPSGSGRNVSGTEMVTPRSTTDYVANAQADGGGADKTAQLTVVASYGTEAVEYKLTNADTASIFITKLQAVGKGIFDYDPFESIREDTASQTVDGVITLTVDFKYEPDITITQGYGDVVLAETTSDDVIVKWVTFIANSESSTMWGFMTLEPGDRFTMAESQSGVDQDFFLQGYEARILENNIVEWTIIPRAADLQSFWVLGTSRLEQETRLGIG